jgi:gas vesicle protein
MNFPMADDNIIAIPSYPQPVKRCSKCNIEYPLTLEYWNQTGANNPKLRTWCKVCARHYGALYRKANQQKVKARHIEDYQKNKDKYKARAKQRTLDKPEDIKTTRAKWLVEHSEDRKSYSRQYYGEHSEDIKQKVSEWRSDNREHAQDSAAQRYLKNAEHIKARTREFAKTPEGRAKALVYQHNNRAKRRGLINDLTLAQWSMCIGYFKNTCAYCGEPLKLGQKMARDHYIPVAKGGGTTATNIIPACHSGKGAFVSGCNSLKKQADPVEFVYKKFGKRKGGQIIARIEAYFEWVKQQDSPRNSPQEENNG